MARTTTGRFRSREKLVQEVVRLRDKKGWTLAPRRRTDDSQLY